MPNAADVFLTFYFLVLLTLCIYGCHRYFLVWLFYRHRLNQPATGEGFFQLPSVTVQLPMYNESRVAERVINAAARLDYPSDRLQIQILDDSTDVTARIAEESASRWRAKGLDIRCLHRGRRLGYKAGALSAGTQQATGEFICIFDADFVPPPDILRKLIHFFSDSKVGVVQARWEHLNRGDSMLTKAQAVLLDGHFIVEHCARNRSGRFISFNGTAGIWRKACIEDAGGWHHDTLTEDLDLSYRAQMKGWRFVYLPEVTAPAELPPEMAGFKAQQHRWTKGGVQTLRKLLPAVLRSPLPIRIKIEAFFHLTSCVVYLFVLALTMMVVPALMMRQSIFEGRPLVQGLFDLSLFGLACCSTITFYVVGQRESRRTWSQSLRYIPFLMCLGLGISLNNARAVLSGLFTNSGEFVRTPKFAGGPSETAVSPVGGTRGRRLHLDWQTALELLVGGFFLLCVMSALADRSTIGAAPFLALFMIGYLYVGGSSLTERCLQPADSPPVLDDARYPL